MDPVLQEVVEEMDEPGEELLWIREAIREEVETLNAEVPEEASGGSVGVVLREVDTSGGKGEGVRLEV